ncbi:suppressor of fused domain protein [Leptospira alstonii]|uniref:Suppressor of fused protein n=2 Tax=Leptospira alstonii TaxID=28452 RepID=M6CXE4_9LEPT|nr:suppressor of fused domain protein [Leptospira alstonii]EMJ93628.1 suppressor of fused protein [Leptospira alstonii serovar Sichuan str. 79601]EQA81362.1 suppressor of fused protein [Leptospira alstonii serovar Pingchang str. 80-412]
MNIFSKIFKTRKDQEPYDPTQEPESLGWLAIDEITSKTYPSKMLSSAITPKIMPIHDRTGKSVLYQLAVFDLDDHWLYVSYGCSELFEKTWDDPDFSGLGYELTFRLKKGSHQTPPIWPMPLMNDIAAYAMTGAGLGPTQSINFGRPIDETQKTKLTGVLFVEDPELPSTDTPYGILNFLQLVGIDSETLQKIKSEGSSGTISEIQRKTKLYITEIE